VTPHGLCPVCLLEIGEAAEGESETSIDIPGYVIIGEIGQGGFATVYEALQLQPMVRPAAIKLLNTADPSLVRRLEDESTILANLHHPGIIPIWDAGLMLDGRAWLSMPLLSGSSFADWLHRSAPDPIAIAAVLKQIAEAVAYAHAHGVVHRDLKPSNIVMTPRDEGKAQPVLIDFGLGHAVHGPASLGREATVLGTWMGTPLYMAPEQLAGKEATAATDIHALGLLLAEALIGQPAMQSIVDSEGGPPEWQKRRAQWRWPEKLASRKEAPLRWIAERAMAFEPQDRYKSARELADDLQNWLDNKPVKAAGARWQYHSKCFLRRHRRLATAAVAATAFVIATAMIGRVHLDHVHRNELARAEAIAVHARALEDFRVGMGDRALEKLESTLEKDPGNQDLVFTARALRALAPSAIRLPDIELPFHAERISPVHLGWLIEDASGQTHLLDLQDKLLQVDSADISRWRNSNELQAPLQTSVGPGSRFTLRHPDDGLPALQPIDTGTLPGEIAVHWERGWMAKVDGGRTVQRWDISMAGKSRDRHHFSSAVPWFAFERNLPHLSMRHQNGKMRAWRQGEAPGHAMQFPVFDSVVTHSRVGENHARGTRPGWDGLRMLAELALWNARNPSDRISAVAGAREVDHVAFGTNGGKLLFWTPGKGLQEGQPLHGSPSVMAINGTGRHVVAIDANRSAEWVDMQSGQKERTWEIEHVATSASLLDAPSPGHLPTLLVGTRTGEVIAYDLRKAAELWRVQLAKRNAQNRSVQVHGLPGGKTFLAGIQGGYQLEVRKAANGAPDGEAFSMRHGLDFFFLSADGRIVVTLDQAPSGHGELRLFGLEIRRDLIPTLPHRARVLWAGLAMDGGVLATATDDGIVTRWSLTDGVR